MRWLRSKGGLETRAVSVTMMREGAKRHLQVLRNESAAVAYSEEEEREELGDEAASGVFPIGVGEVVLRRPKKRSDCVDGQRPCPWVSCRHHLYLDVSRQDPSVMKINFPHTDPLELPETCVLDVAEKGSITLDETGKYLNVTRERVRQIEVKILGTFREKVENALDDSPEQVLEVLREFHGPVPGKEENGE